MKNTIETQFFVLKKTENDYEVKVEQIPNLVSENFKKFYNRQITSKEEMQDFYNSIRIIFLPYKERTFTYCSNLSDSFATKEICLFDYITKVFHFIKTSSNPANPLEKIDYNKIKAKSLEYLNNNKELINYYLFFDRLTKNNENLIISNRIGGWSNPKYKISDDFSLEVKSNFGFGRASYFYITIKYKNLNISPYSDWIFYRFCKFYEVSRYTRKYHHIGVLSKKIIHYESWSEVINFAHHIVMLIENDIDKFVDNYIIKECEILINGLENILRNESFDFYDISSEDNLSNLPDYKRINLKGEELLEFRTEKILGALDFVEQLNTLSTLVDLTKYKQTIEKKTTMFFPIANEEYLRIKPIYFQKQKECDLVTKQYEKYIKNSHEQIEKLEIIVSKSKVTETNIKMENEIDRIKKEIKKECTSYLIVYNNCNHLRNTYEHFREYVKKYNSYFSERI